jgi:hypothetical protein
MGCGCALLIRGRYDTRATWKEIFMSASSIGIQAIMPKTGTSPQQNPPQQADAPEADDAPPKQAPPPPGMGKLVDKTA